MGVSRLAVTQLLYSLVGSNPTCLTSFVDKPFGTAQALIGLSRPQLERFDSSSINYFWEHDEIGLSYLTFNQTFWVRAPVLLPVLWRLNREVQISLFESE